jgi:hypothetical protein
MGETAKRTHNLNELVNDFITFARREWDTDVPGWIIARIKELTTIDPASTAFRYRPVSVF